MATQDHQLMKYLLSMPTQCDIQVRDHDSPHLSPFFRVSKSK